MNMTTSRTYRWLVLGVAAVVATVGGTCGGAGDCVQSKCASGAWMHIPLSVAPASLVGATVRACRNLECYSAAMPDLPTAGGAGATLYFADVTFVVGNYWRKADDSIGVDVEWHVGSPEEAQDGDHYVVTLVAAAGTETTLLDKTASYQPSARSPEECPQSPHCLWVELVP
jgi:hypothetical protein